MTTRLKKVYDFVVSYYSMEELKTLCFEMGVEFENLGGLTRNAKARELVLKLGHERQFTTLFEALKATRPNLFEQEQFDATAGPVGGQFVQPRRQQGVIKRAQGKLLHPKGSSIPRPDQA